MHAQDIPATAIEPGEQEYLLAGPETPETLDHLGLEDQPGLGRTFVGLTRRRFEIGQGDPTTPTAVTLKLVICVSQ